jgi:hypothetical protein
METLSQLHVMWYKANKWCVPEYLVNQVPTLGAKNKRWQALEKCLVDAGDEGKVLMRLGTCKSRQSGKPEMKCVWVTRFDLERHDGDLRPFLNVRHSPKLSNLSLGDASP